MSKLFDIYHLCHNIYIPSTYLVESWKLWGWILKYLCICVFFCMLPPAVVVLSVPQYLVALLFLCVCCDSWWPCGLIFFYSLDLKSSGKMFLAAQNLLIIFSKQHSLRSYLDIIEWPYSQFDHSNWENCKEICIGAVNKAKPRKSSTCIHFNLYSNNGEKIFVVFYLVFFFTFIQSIFNLHRYMKFKVLQIFIFWNLTFRGIFNATFSIPISHYELFLKEKIKMRLFCII